MVATISFLAAASEGVVSKFGNTIGDGTILTLGGLSLLLVLVKTGKELWESFKPEPPHPDLASKAELAEVVAGQHKLATRLEMQLIKTELTAEIDRSRGERKKATDELFEQSREILKTISCLNGDVQRALGRLEGRAETISALKEILGDKHHDTC